MEVSFEKKDNLLLMAFAGRLDTVASGDLMPKIGDAMDPSVSDVTVDCSALDYISSSGLRIFMTLYKRTAAKGGKFPLKNLSPQVCEVLNITGMATLFNIE